MNAVIKSNWSILEDDLTCIITALYTQSPPWLCCDANTGFSVCDNAASYIAVISFR